MKSPILISFIIKHSTFVMRCLKFPFPSTSSTASGLQGLTQAFFRQFFGIFNFTSFYIAPPVAFSERIP